MTSGGKTDETTVNDSGSKTEAATVRDGGRQDRGSSFQ